MSGAQRLSPTPEPASPAAPESDPPVTPEFGEAKGPSAALAAHARSTASELRSEVHSADWAPGQARGDEREARGDKGDKVVYAARTRDLVIASLVDGKFAVVAVVVIGAAWNLADALGVTGGLTQAASRASVPVLVGLGIVAFGVIGLAASVVKFHGFRVTTDATGQLTIAFGLIERKKRTLAPDAIEGVMLKANLVEQALGRVRLSLLTLDSAGQLGTNAVLPSLPVAVVRGIVAEHFPSSVGGASLLDSGRSGLGRSALWLATAIAVPLGLYELGTQSLRPGWAALTAVTAWWAWVALARIATSRLTLTQENGLVRRNTRFAAESDMFVRLAAIHGLRTRLAPPRGTKPLMATVHVYAGKPLSLRAALPAPDVLDALTRAVTGANKVAERAA
jgi:putative membrane protein